MTRKSIATEHAPKALGPYSQAIRATGETLYLAGQIGLDPATQALVDGGVEAETTRALDNIRAVLQAAGFSMNDIVKTTLYLVDLSHFQKVNEIYARYFTAEPPARSTVAVAALPKSAKVEIDCIAVH